MKRINPEGNAKQIGHAINSPTMAWNWFGHLVEDTRRILHSLMSWKCTFANREANEAAYRLAKAAITNVSDRIWRSFTLNCINDIVLIEQLALSLDCWWSTSSIFQSFINYNQFCFKKKKFKWIRKYSANYKMKKYFIFLLFESTKISIYYN